MAIDAGFMAALMKIPYYAQLSEENGDEWLSDLFQSLEVEAYDFSPFTNLGTDSAFGTPTGDVNAGAAQPGDGSVEDKADSEDGGAATKRAQAEIENAQAAANAKGVESQSEAKSSANAASNGGKERGFDNAIPQMIAPDRADWNRFLVYQIMQQRAADQKFAMGDSDEPVVVGLTGAFDDMKLSAFDDKIYTSGLYDGSGKTTVSAGEGTDTLFLTAGGLKVDLGGTNDFGKYGGKVELKSVENVVGSDGDDTITGSNADNKLSGRDGDDKIDGGGGNDTISGGGGKNNLSGSAGNDAITGGSGVDNIDGGAGSDTIKAGAGADKASGGDGEDVIDGGAGSDNLSGDGGDDEIDGGGGDDEIDGGSGKDEIDGGSGNDLIGGGSDDDEVDGGEGDDEIDGDAGDDTLNGDAGNDTIDGGEGADEIDGGEGDDVILGGDGNDVIKAGAGADTVTGGAGGDTITGGDGADVYVYTAQTDSGLAAGEFDVYTDFDIATDKFDLTALLESDEFEFLDAEGTAFSGNGPEVRWDKDAGKTTVEIDIDGDGNADMKFELDDEVDLTDSNFLV